MALALAMCGAAVTRGEPSARCLSLKEALTIAEQRGFDALLADAAVRGAEGDLTAARRLPNPAVSGAYLWSGSVPASIGETTGRGYTIGAADQGALEGLASGKRGLRIREAQLAVASARSNREDALRLLRFATTQAFFGVLLAGARRLASHDVAASYAQTLELVGVRRRYGAVSEVDVARVETAKLEAEQAVTAAEADVAQARATLGVLLGGEPLDETDLVGELNGGPPDWLAPQTRESLREEALRSRPDVRAARADLERADAALDLARRERFPDVTLSAGYARQGPEAAPVTPPTFSVGAALDLPLFNQRQGEIARAESDRVAAKIALDRAAARAVSDVDSAWAVYLAAKEQLARMADRLLGRARQARDLVRYQYREGAISLVDLLDAERTALAVELEHQQDLYGLRTAVAALEAATGQAVTP